MTRILIIQGHPDPRPERLCRGLAFAYAQGAREAGHEVRVLDVAALDVPVLRTVEEWQGPPPSEDVRRACADVLWAEHLVIVFPLWLGALPAGLKAFLEQVFRPSLGGVEGKPDVTAIRLHGRSARIVVTMGMPALAYRWYFGAHSLKSLERNILKFCGVGPVRDTVIGMAGKVSENRAERLFAHMRRIGAKAR